MKPVEVTPVTPTGLQRPSRHGMQRLSPATLTLVVLAHGGVWVALQTLGMVSVPTPPAPLMVELLQPTSDAPKMRPPEPSKPTVTPAPAPATAATRSLPRPEAPMLASESGRAEPALDVAKAEKAPVAPATTPTAQPAAPAAMTPTAAPAPAATAPRFDAAYLDNPAPNYPPLSRRGREEGRVVLKVFVEASGQAGKVEVQTSSGFERLDRAAASAVSRWKFVPAKQGAEAVAAWVLVPIVFSLKD